LRIGLPGAAALAAGFWGAMAAPWVAHRSMQLFHSESEPRRAMAHLERALRFNPYQHAYQFQLGRIVWTARGRLDRRRVAAADRILERASRLNPHDGRADQERGRLLAQAAVGGVMPHESALRAALRRYEEAARRRPLDAECRKEAGIAALRLGEPARARREARAALALEPNFLDAHLLLADAEWRAGNAPAARAALTSFTEARERLASYTAANEYEELLLKYNDAVLARLERETAR
jgi:tetratricopeptide (TPR) repeat protein